MAGILLIAVVHLLLRLCVPDMNADADGVCPVEDRRCLRRLPGSSPASPSLRSPRVYDMPACCCRLPVVDATTTTVMVTSAMVVRVAPVSWPAARLPASLSAQEVMLLLLLIASLAVTPRELTTMMQPLRSMYSSSAWILDLTTGSAAVEEPLRSVGTCNMGLTSR